MAAVAVAAATPPILLEIRLQLSRLNIRFKIRGMDMIFAIRGDSDVIIFVDDLLRRQRSLLGHQIPVPGSWELRSNGTLLNLACWDPEKMGGDLMEICECASIMARPTGIITIHRQDSSPVYIDAVRNAIIELPQRPFIPVILDLSQRSGKKKRKVHLLKTIELVIEKSVTFTRLLPRVGISQSQVSSVVVSDRTNIDPGVDVASGQFDDAISSFLDRLGLKMEIILK
ncbi:hypothetical protein MMC13_007434 [Lambiella insularis]|nr:hypothetical protein [Lambiella insularis]